MEDHKWVYESCDDERYRKCSHCKMEEWYSENEDRWIWMSSEDFMDTDNVCGIINEHK
jgi:hypothetical protein